MLLRKSVRLVFREAACAITRAPPASRRPFGSHWPLLNFAAQIVFPAPARPGRIRHAQHAPRRGRSDRGAAARAAPGHRLFFGPGRRGNATGTNYSRSRSAVGAKRSLWLWGYFFARFSFFPRWICSACPVSRSAFSRCSNVLVALGGCFSGALCRRAKSVSVLGLSACLRRRWSRLLARAYFRGSRAVGRSGPGRVILRRIRHC